MSNYSEIELTLSDLQVNYSNFHKKKFAERLILIDQLIEIIKLNSQALSEVESAESGRNAIHILNRELNHGIKLSGYLRQILLNQGSPEGINISGKYHAVSGIQPIGLILSLLPENYALLCFFWQVFPALLCGNACVAKPHQKNQKSLALLESLISNSEISKYLKFVFGDSEIGEAIVKDDRISMITITGKNSSIERIKNLAVQKIVLSEGSNSGIAIATKNSNFKFCS
jgi:acyl-CoA reductase-like NAD-dependent aldehyde dehydrogenase